MRQLLLCAILVLTPIAVLAQAQAKKPQPAPPKAQPKDPAPKEPPPEEAIPPAAPGALFPAVVARVNGKPILGRDLEQRVQEQLAPMGNPKWENLREDYRQQLVAELFGALIGSELVYQRALTSGLKATEAEVQAAMTQFSKRFATDAELNQFLATRGSDRQGLVRELERGLTIDKFIQENVGKKITVTPAEISQYYQQRPDEFRHPDLVRTSHILFMMGQGATQQQDNLIRQRAEGVLARAKKGEDFAKLAKEYSMDSSASNGGDIGPSPRGQLAPEYEEAAFALAVGAISDLVRTQFGYHIIKVTEKKKAGLATLEEVRPQLTSFLKEQKTQTELAKLIEEMRTQSKIEAYIPFGSPPAAKAPTASSPRP